ncbi:hypothetical protein AUR04nite_32820 [Glutamicibacter uratoxydans]|uniref:Uncharacterized protein n=1 Tax=Glutamicibacter uratoxydans TaxID=43667 RepID=A0A4Y4DWG1_GLUUR|nr:hypothetical protein [Glutamicibacter uratoxydans]GED07750.1 hypothetical protein AUR04nite_32820 [Glutamicibacter uratoxydans]
MKMSFTAWCVTAIIAAGLAFFGLSLFAYFSGQNSLIFIGMGIFMAIVMTSTSLIAQRQNRAKKEQVK